MQTAIMQVAIQEATVAVIAMKEADTGPTTDANIASVGKAHRPRHGIQPEDNQHLIKKTQLSI